MKIITRLWLFAVLLALFSVAAAARNIATAEELYEFCSGAVLTEEINLTGEEYDLSPYMSGSNPWKPITQVGPGVGFYGNGAVIKGLDLSKRYNEGSKGYSGFIAKNYGIVADLTIQLGSSSNTSAFYLGPVVAHNEGSILGCRVFGDADDDVVISVGKAGFAGGIAGDNFGLIQNCIVNDVCFDLAVNLSYGGGIAGLCSEGGEIGGCTVYNVAIAASNSCTVGGIVGRVEGYEFDPYVPVTVTECSAIYSSLVTDGGYLGGIAGFAKACEITDCRVNFVDIIHSGSLDCNVGGLFGEFESEIDTPSTAERCYYAEGIARGMQYKTTDNAGGIVGSYYADDSAATIFEKCYFCTDFTDVKILYGERTGNASDDNFVNCAGLTKDDMTAPNWAPQNMGSSWFNYGPDNYPVFSDGVPVSFDRLHRLTQYLPIGYRLYYDGVDVASLGLVDRDTEFDPYLFYIVGPEDSSLDLELEYVTVNGQRMTDTITAGDFGELTFSAVVDNCASRYGVIPVLEEAVEMYAKTEGIYNPASRAEFAAIINDTTTALNEEYLFMTWDRCDELIARLMEIEMDKFSYGIDFEHPDSTVYYWSTIDCDWFETEGEYRLFGEEVGLKAVPNDGYRFLYWADSAGNKLSEDPEFTYTVNRTTTLTAVVAPENSYDFIYKDTYGKIYKIQPVTDYSEVAYPAEVGSTGLRTGYAVSGWTNDYDGGLPASGEVTGNVTFTASLTKTSTTYRVTSSVAGEEETANLKLAALFTKTAPDEYEGSAFSYWKDSDSGCVLSYAKTLSVSVYSDMNVEAVYGEAANSVTLAVLQTPIVSSGKIAFTGQVVEGDDFASEIMHGVLLLRSDSAITDLVIDTPGVIVGKSSGYSAVSKTFIINKKNVAEGDTWYGRAFVVYRDTNGVEKIAYSDIKSATM
ncbi:MAG: hypothetical protein IK083_09000 [Abditibacteriota bacterium]|nr:hypothetical protein [Abditibacteriota bacterium]